VGAQQTHKPCLYKYKLGAKGGCVSVQAALIIIISSVSGSGPFCHSWTRWKQMLTNRPRPAQKSKFEIVKLTDSGDTICPGIRATWATFSSLFDSGASGKPKSRLGPGNPGSANLGDFAGLMRLPALIRGAWSVAVQ